MELALSETPWLAGPQFSLADIDVAPYIWRLSNLQLAIFWARRPRVADWLARVTARKSFRKAVIDDALPEWIELMRSTGNEAKPTLEPLIASFHTEVESKSVHS
jgi:glutathione S-transferase